MRITTILLGALLLAGTARAQTAISPLTGSNGTPAGPAVQTAPAAAATPAPATAPSAARRKLPERFAAANTSHDGHLTLEQAKAGRMRAVTRDFGKIDKDHHGYVTLDEIRAYTSEHRAARRGAASKPE